MDFNKHESDWQHVGARRPTNGLQDADELESFKEEPQTTSSSAESVQSADLAKPAAATSDRGQGGSSLKDENASPTKNIDTVATNVLLVTFNWPENSERYNRVARFVDAFFSKFDDFMKPPRHPKWHEAAIRRIFQDGSASRLPKIGSSNTTS